MASVRVAIVGAGNMASEHARAFASLPGVELAGFYAGASSRVAALAAKYRVPAVGSLDLLRNECHADAVVVAVSETSALETAFACFEHSWVCLLEKPAGLNLSQAEKILGRCNERGRRCFVAFNRRSYSATRSALASLNGDTSPRLISVLDQQDLDAVRRAGRPDAVIQNYMYANSIHLIDYFSLFARGAAIAVEPIMKWTPDRPGVVLACIRFESGDVGVYQAVWNAPGPWSVTVTNSALRLEMRPLERLGIQRRGEFRLMETPPDAIDTEYKPGLHFQAEQLVAAVRGTENSLASLEDSTRSMALCARIYGLDR